VKNHTQTVEVSFLKTEPWKPSFQFLTFEVGSVRFLPARRYASAGLCDSDVSVCPSVHLLHASIVPRRAKAGS